LNPEESARAEEEGEIVVLDSTPMWSGRETGGRVKPERTRYAVAPLS
jgi:hypothetical protein